MSKAFFKEDTVPDDGPAIATRPSEPLPITHEGYARLLAELNAIAKDDEAKKTRALTLKTILATVRVVPRGRMAALVLGARSMSKMKTRRSARTASLGPMKWMRSADSSVPSRP
jgi:hypothetical protein